MLHLLTLWQSKLIIMAICGALGAIGGHGFLPARRFIQPFIVVCCAWVYSYTIWAISMLDVIGIFVEGYGEKSPLRKALTDPGARGMWLFLAAVAYSLSMTITHHIYGGWAFTIPYCIIAGILGATLRNIPQLLGDFIEYSYLTGILFFIH